ncbi:MAG: hypothetical protein J6386_17130 [Candidatus Synoicihabitans palmerolidicus]|nr:hypothetical protein [Candidatus Synoicihabitans palmerolidicus]
MLSNAIKFPPAGGRVSLSVDPTPDADGHPLVRFSVIDSGVGMDEATKTRVFQRFTQADSSTTRRFGGTELGLAITARLAK